jgi:hypothetical protein
VLAVSDIQDMSEDLCDGQALRLMVGMLDPRPQGSGLELQSLEDPVVIQLAARTHSAAATRAAELPLPSMGRFNSSAEISSMVALTLQAVRPSSRGWKALSQAGFFTLVGDLLKEGIIPRPAIIIIGDMFRCEGVQDQERLDLARKFLGLGFLQYLLDRIDGTGHSRLCSVVQDSFVQYSGRFLRAVQWSISCRSGVYRAGSLRAVQWRIPSCSTVHALSWKG